MMSNHRKCDYYVKNIVGPRLDTSAEICLGQFGEHSVFKIIRVWGTFS